MTITREQGQLVRERKISGKKSMPAQIRERLRDDRGVGVVEIILILVILIALVLIFKTKMTSLVNTIFTTITSNANSVMQ